MGKRCSLRAAYAAGSNCPTLGPDLHDAWQDDPRDGRQSFHPVALIMPEAGSRGKLPGGRYYPRVAASNAAMRSEQTS